MTESLFQVERGNTLVFAAGTYLPFIHKLFAQGQAPVVGCVDARRRRVFFGWQNGVSRTRSAGNIPNRYASRTDAGSH